MPLGYCVQLYVEVYLCALCVLMVIQVRRIPTRNNYHQQQHDKHANVFIRLLVSTLLFQLVRQKAENLMQFKSMRTANTKPWRVLCGAELDTASGRDRATSGVTPMPSCCVVSSRTSGGSISRCCCCCRCCESPALEATKQTHNLYNLLWRLYLVFVRGW